MWVTLLRGASNPEVANNHNNLCAVCMCTGEPMACMYGLSFFQLLELWLNVHFQQSARSENYWAPLGFTHSLTLISFLRSDEKWGRSWVGLTIRRSGWSPGRSAQPLSTLLRSFQQVSNNRNQTSVPFYRQISKTDAFFDLSHEGMVKIITTK